MVLDRLGARGPFRTYLSALYSSPLARVYMPGHLSAIFQLCKGTRQGCPLCPLLFNLALEPLSRYLKDRTEIRGIMVGREELKLIQFADDLLFFLTHPFADASKVFEQLQSFGLCSGLKINVTKSESLVLRRGSRDPGSSLSNLPVKIAKSYSLPRDHDW